MPKAVYFIILYFILANSLNILGQKASCGFDELLDRHSKEDTTIIDKLSKINLFLSEEINKKPNKINLRSTYTIPVVVHIVWQKPEENISDQDVLNQIEILNRDFSGENDDLEKLPLEFKQFASKSKIQFCLVSEDPKGLPTSGIVRVKTDIESIGIKDELYYSEMNGSSSWDSKKYLNIWVANTGDFITGFGTFPEQVEMHKQGVVIHPTFFSNNQSKRYNRGRVAVHEVGHYFGLNHIWSNSKSCEMDDGVDDTPLQENRYIGCPNHPQLSCGSNDMFMNFMDYVDDDCMIMFTEGQMERMIATLEFFRHDLINSHIPCIANTSSTLVNNFQIFPNPTDGEFRIDFTRNIGELGKVEVYNTIGASVFIYEGVLRNGMQINLGDIPQGIYIIKIGNQGRKFLVI